MSLAAPRASTPEWLQEFAALAASLLCAAALAAGPVDAWAHGTAGKRFFPATLATDDPFVADELSLPTFQRFKTPASGDEPATVEYDYSVDFTKRITENLGIGFGATYLHLRPDQGDSQNGFDNLAASVKYQFFKSDEHETILSVGVDWDIGGTGAARVGAESFSTLTPGIFFGKGFGDLFDGYPYLKPLAITGTVGVAIPTQASATTVTTDPDTGDFLVAVDQHPNVLNVGLAIEYSIPYLQSFVKDIGLREPFNRVIPLVEISIQNPLDRGQAGQTTGTVNPGFIWAGRYYQLGLEAVIPINNRTGNQVGILAQLHFYLDDLFPKTIGRPLYGS